MAGRVEDWTVEALCDWIRSLGAGEAWVAYAATCHQEKIDGATFCRLSTDQLLEELERLGFSATHARSTVNALAEHFKERCDKHQVQICLFCRNCQVPLCPKCVTSHRGEKHYLLPLDEITANDVEAQDLVYEAEVAASLEQQRAIEAQEFREAAAAKGEEVRSAIRAYFADYERLLKETCARMLAFVETSVQEHGKQMEKANTEHLATMEKLNTLIDQYQKHWQRKQFVALLAVKSDIQRHLRKLAVWQAEEEQRDAKRAEEMPRDRDRDLLSSLARILGHKRRSVPDARCLGLQAILPDIHKACQTALPRVEALGAISSFSRLTEERITNREIRFTIIALDIAYFRLNKGGESFVIFLTEEGDGSKVKEVSLNVRDKQDGTYDVVLVAPDHPPVIFVHVQLGATPLRRSPLRIAPPRK